MSSPLPFLKDKKPQAGVIVEHRSESDSKENHGLAAAAMELLKAIESKDAKGIAMALRCAFELLDSEPHEEGPHLDEESN